jgi:hypothetical protein
MTRALAATRTTSTPKKRKVRFGQVHIREHFMTLGDNPSVSIGAPVTMSDGYTELESMSIDDYECSRVRRTKLQYLLLSYYKRQEIFDAAGISKKEIKRAERQVYFDQSQRKLSRYLCFPHTVKDSVKACVGRQKNRRFLRSYAGETAAIKQSTVL